MKGLGKLSKNCSIHAKNREISGPYNFRTPVNVFETEAGYGPLALPVTKPLEDIS